MVAVVDFVAKGADVAMENRMLQLGYLVAQDCRYGAVVSAFTCCDQSIYA
jgi:hypothetical protein